MPTSTVWKLGEFDEYLGYDCMTRGIGCGPAGLDGADYGQKPCALIEDEAKSKRIADARLIAAAPDLLFALNALFDDYKQLADSGDAGFWKIEDLDVVKQALAAISKAEGRDV